MAETLLSVGLDVGTTSTQLIVSRLTVENKGGAFSVPALEITERKVLYKSPVHFTPLLSKDLVDAEELGRLLRKEYAQAGIDPESVQTGAIIITGETSRKENARSVLQSLSDLAGEFVVTTAGPDLESQLSARGAGAVELSLHTDIPVLHMDIGGGTSNLSLIQNGKILRTGCLNVGGRLIRMDKNMVLTYISPVLEGLFPKKTGEIVTAEELQAIASTLTRALEMAAGLHPAGPLLQQLTTKEASAWEIPKQKVFLSFSGGVAECMRSDFPFDQFGDLGPILGRCILKSSLCSKEYRLGEEAIRATVIGAGCHSTQLSGSTVFLRNLMLPMKNMPVVAPRESETLEDTLARLSAAEGNAVLALTGIKDPSYRQVQQLAAQIATAHRGPIFICLQQDMAKALGQALCARMPEGTPILCLDRLSLSRDCYLDVLAPVGPALPVVVKTLILER